MTITDKRSGGRSAALADLLLNAYDKNIFSAASVAYTSFSARGEDPCLAFCGTTEEGKGEAVVPSTLFDLASLTKPLVTLLCVLCLIERGRLTWHTTLGQLFGGTVPTGLRAIDVHALLCHSSGLPAHRDFWKEAILIDVGARREWLKQTILAELPTAAPGTHHVYSDLGYMLLGLIVEECVDLSLESYWNDMIAEPLGLREQLHFPVPLSPRDERKYAATGTCPWTGVLLKGRVHDDNCRALGGVCGHAGLFGTAGAVLSLCREFMYLLKGKPSRLPIAVPLFQSAARRVGRSEWTPGFNLPSGYGSSSGRYFSAGSIGHLGFTGTSFWLDPQRGIIIVLLTNRVIKGSDQRGIKRLRPRIHDCIGETMKPTEREGVPPG